MSDGTRTRGILDHNQVLYQLSYTHRERRVSVLEWRRLEKCTGWRGVVAPSYFAGVSPCFSVGRTYFTAIARAVSVSGPGAGTKTASR